MQTQAQPQSKPSTLTLHVESASFGTNGSIPIEHTADGANVPPQLSWRGVPEGTKSVAVVVEDLDSVDRNVVHWIVVGILPHVPALVHGALPEGAVEGTNDFGTIGWHGPQAKGGRHRYVFRVYALDNVPKKPGMTKQDLWSAIKGHTLAQGELIGTYDRNGHTHDKSTNEAPVKQVGGRT